jgi:hypothetical protein
MARAPRRRAFTDLKAMNTSETTCFRDVLDGVLGRYGTALPTEYQALMNGILPLDPPPPAAPNPPLSAAPNRHRGGRAKTAAKSERQR